MIFHIALYVPDAKPGRCTGRGGGRDGTINVKEESRGRREVVSRPSKMQTPENEKCLTVSSETAMIVMSPAEEAGESSYWSTMTIKPVGLCRFREDLEQGAWWKKAADGSRKSDVFDPGGAEELDYNRGCFG